MVVLTKVQKNVTSKCQDILAHGSRLIENARPRTFFTTTPSMTSNIDSGPHTPERNSKRHKYNIICKTRFYNAFDLKYTGNSLRQICKKPDINIPPSTVRTWLRKRKIIRSPTRTRKTSMRLGRKYRILISILDNLLRKDHPLNYKPYAMQVKKLNLPIKL